MCKISEWTAQQWQFRRPFSVDKDRYIFTHSFIDPSETKPRKSTHNPPYTPFTLSNPPIKSKHVLTINKLEMKIIDKVSLYQLIPFLANEVQPLNNLKTLKQASSFKNYLLTPRTSLLSYDLSFESSV